MAAVVNITINGRPWQAKPGQSVLKAALDAGVYIPHFCYHPALTVEGNCRMCLVEVSPGPKKPVISCGTTVSEGLAVTTDSQTLRETRKAILSFLLMNHPLDCPVCDKSHECPLQDITYAYGPVASLQWEAGLHEVKRRYVRTDIAEKLFVEMDRCIHCTRCVRYFRQKVGVAGFGRTLRNAALHIDAPFGLPGTDYELNAADICPVGALGDKSFRFRQRVWDLTPRPSLCAGCSVGCNITAWVKEKRIVRITPRLNEAVNSHWMCDRGRTLMAQANAPDRGTTPLVRIPGSPRYATGLGEALAATRQAVEETAAAHGAHRVALWLSPSLSLEALYLAAHLARDGVLSGCRVVMTPGCNPLPVLHPDEAPLPRSLASLDHTPDSGAAGLLGIPAGGPGTLADLVTDIEAGEVKALLVLGDDLFDLKRGPGFDAAALPVPQRLSKALETLPFLLCAGMFPDTGTAAAATVYLPLKSHFESTGSFVNRQGTIQRFAPVMAREDQERSLEDHALLAALLTVLRPGAPAPDPAGFLPTGEAD